MSSAAYHAIAVSNCVAHDSADAGSLSVSFEFTTEAADQVVLAGMPATVSCTLAFDDANSNTDFMTRLAVSGVAWYTRDGVLTETLRL